MVLATIIRLEFAYPGVGVLAGDSIQYLSLASAHGVIMVFFMIMPLLFGAFANFLLPTQLGVHDVAFPRLNSAAFWFLPGGLLMLCQLVCIDRRYQRMNCFNIREAESLLKRRFFTDLINSKDQHVLLNKTAIGLRYKLNKNTSLDNNILNMYNYGIEMTPQARTANYTSFFKTNINYFNNTQTFELNSYFFKLISYFYSTNIFFLLNSFFFFFLEKSFLLIDLSNTLNGVYLIISFCEKIISNIKNTVLAVFYVMYNIFSFFFAFTVEISIYILEFLLRVLIFTLYRFTEWVQSTLAAFYNWFLSFYPTLLNSLSSFFVSLSGFVKKFGFFIKNFNFSSVPSTVCSGFSYIFKSIILFKEKFIEESAFDYEIYRFKINYNFLENSFFFNMYNLIKITLNNWFFCFSLKNTVYRLKCIYDRNVEYVPYDSKEAEPISYRDLWYKSLSVAYCDSLMLEFYSLIYFFLNIPVLFVNSFLYLCGSHFSVINYTKISIDFFFWFLNTVNGTNVWKKKIEKEDLLSLKFFFFNQIFANLGNFFYRYLIIAERVFNFFKPIFEPFFTFLFNVLKNLTLFLYNTEMAIFAAIIEYFDEVKKIWDMSNLKSFLIKWFEKFYLFFSSFGQTRLFKFFYNKTYSLFYSTHELINNNNVDKFLLNNEEISTTSRVLRFNNPIFKYDYKSGDYFPKLYKDLYSFLIPSILDLTSGLRTPSWYFSITLNELLDINLTFFIDNLEKRTHFSTFSVVPTKNNKITHSDAFYNFFFSLNNPDLDLNLKWISTNSLNVKFNRMFLTSSLQQRLYSNWRTLKFTREAWRCKMLLARHQKTLFRRYMHEDGVFWSIERNAKDLIPGWAMITPFSSRTRYTAVGKTDIGLMGVLLVLNSSIISGANFLVTYRYLSTLNNRKMRDARAFFTEAVMVASWMMILANPMLVIGIVMLISDRHWQTSFFDYSGGGDTVLFQHMFWFFGHPEVYIIIIPTFGFTNTMMSYYFKKRVSARASLLYSLYTIAFLGFFVWGHHMYMVGLSHTTRMLFSTLTVMISVPAATKIMHWCVTTANSAFAMELPLLFTFTFIFFFVSGGISGMCVAHTGMDVLFHDTFYVIGHFHVMLAGGAMFASFGAFYFYFPAIFGVKYSRIYAYLHYTYYLIGQLMTVIPMFWLGYAGMPRRVLDYPAAFGGWHSVISAGHMLNVAGLMAFFIMIFDSLRQAKAATRNTFGVSRYNTRLNFYIYETSRLIYIQQKAFFLFKSTKPTTLLLNGKNYFNLEPYESVLFSYVLTKK